MQKTAHSVGIILIRSWGHWRTLLVLKSWVYMIDQGTKNWIQYCLNTSLARHWFLLGFKLSPCCECFILSFGWFPGVWILYADVSEHSVSSIFIGSVNKKKVLLFTRPMRMEETECSETSVLKTQTHENHPKERIQHRFLIMLFSGSCNHR